MSKPIPANFLAAMSRQPVFAPYQRQDAASVAVAPKPEPSPAQERWRAGEEKALNRLLVTEFRRRGYFVVVSRTDKPTSQQRGIPDLIVCCGNRVSMVELKAGNGKLSKAQRECHAELAAAGVPVRVAYSFDEAVKFIVAILGAKSHAP